MLIARHHHPIWTKVFSVTMLAVGLALLWAGGPLLIAALVCYGAGVGLESIARGTLPLAIFGPDRYPVLMGRNRSTEPYRSGSGTGNWRNPVVGTGA